MLIYLFFSFFLFFGGFYMFLDICLILQWSECMLNNKQISYCCDHKTSNFLTSNQVNIFHVFFWFSTCFSYQWYFCGFFPLKSSQLYGVWLLLLTMALHLYKYWRSFHCFFSSIETNHEHLLSRNKTYERNTLDPFRSGSLQWQTKPHVFIYCWFWW